jgi:hypothetical protein
MRIQLQRVLEMLDRGLCVRELQISSSQRQLYRGIFRPMLFQVIKKFAIRREILRLAFRNLTVGLKLGCRRQIIGIARNAIHMH